MTDYVLNYIDSGAGVETWHYRGWYLCLVSLDENSNEYPYWVARAPYETDNVRALLEVLGFGYPIPASEEISAIQEAGWHLGAYRTPEDGDMGITDKIDKAEAALEQLRAKNMNEAIDSL